MKKLKTPGTKTHYIKGPLHTGWCDGGSVKAGQCIYIALSTRSSLTMDTCYLSPGQYLDTASVGLPYTCLLPSPSTLRRSIWAWTQPAGAVRNQGDFQPDTTWQCVSNINDCFLKQKTVLERRSSSTFRTLQLRNCRVCTNTPLWQNVKHIYVCVCVW